MLGMPSDVDHRIGNLDEVCGFVLENTQQVSHALNGLRPHLGSGSECIADASLDAFRDRAGRFGDQGQLADAI